MAYIGDFRLGDTLDFKFTTRNFTTGVPFTLAGSPVLSAYVGNSTTEITAGITLTVDFDSRTGMNNVRIVASSGNGFATATNVEVVITTGTVNGVSVVGEVVGTFSIENRSAVMPTTAGRTLDISAGGEAGVDWANVGSPTTAVNLSGTNIKTDQQVDVNTIKTNPVVNAGTITFPTGATLASTTNITAGTITTVTTTTTATNVTTVNGLAANVITAASMAADASAEIADAVWDEAIAGHVAAGSTGEALSNASSAGDPWGTALPGAYSVGEAGYIVGTNLDALITSRMASYTQPTGFLAATFPTGTVANTTNITAGTITTTTNLTTVSNIVTAIEAAIIPVNIKYVNDIEIDGVGSSGDPWGPV